MRGKRLMTKKESQGFDNFHIVACISIAYRASAIVIIREEQHVRVLLIDFYGLWICCARVYACRIATNRKNKSHVCSLARGSGWNNLFEKTDSLIQVVVCKMYERARAYKRKEHLLISSALRRIHILP